MVSLTASAPTFATNSSGKNSAAPGGDLYSVLGVSDQASVDEIKACYFRTVRTLRRQTNIENYQRLNDAYQTLVDARRRSEYDQMRDKGRQVQVLTHQAATALIHDPQKSLALLKNAVEMAPDLTLSHFLLARALMRTEAFPQAIHELQWLLQRAPRDENLLVPLATCYWRLDQHGEAQRLLDQALLINRCHYDALLLRAQILESERNIDAAIAAYEAAIGADNQENSADTDALSRLVALYASRGDRQKIEETLQRIAAVLPEDDSKRVYVLRKLHQIAGEFFERGSYPATAQILRLLENALAAESCPPDLIAAVNKTANRLLLVAEAQQAVRDPLLTESMIRYLAVRYLDRTRSHPEKLTQQINATQTALWSEAQQSPVGFKTALDYLCHAYPHLAATESTLCTGLKARASEEENRHRDRLSVTAAAEAGGSDASGDSGSQRRSPSLLSRLLGRRAA